MSLPAKLIAPCVGASAPAMHFIKVLLPDPLGPIRPWNSPSGTLRSTPPNAVSLPNVLRIPRTSSSATLVPSVAGRACSAFRPESAHPLALGDHETNKTGRLEQDHQQQ